MEAVTKFLSNLNPRRAFALFFCALSLGTIFIFGGWWKPFSPAVPVFAYGAILLAVQDRYFVQFGPQPQDSPYFLGFILTLFEILNVVLIGFPQQNTDSFLFREIGAAILTTAVGLIMRQILLANDQAEEAQDRYSEPSRKKLRKDTVEFHDTQRLFVKLVREFVQVREEMFSSEEKAFAEYLKVLKDGALKLGALPKRVESVLACSGKERLANRGDIVRIRKRPQQYGGKISSRCRQSHRLVCRQPKTTWCRNLIPGASHKRRCQADRGGTRDYRAKRIVHAASGKGARRLRERLFIESQRRRTGDRQLGQGPGPHGNRPTGELIRSRMT